MSFAELITLDLVQQEVFGPLERNHCFHTESEGPSLVYSGHDYYLSKKQTERLLIPFALSHLKYI